MSKAWRIVFIAAVISAAVGTLRLGFGVLLKPLLKEFGWLPGTSSTAYAIQFVFFGLVSPLFGRLSERIGIRVTPTGAWVAQAGSASPAS